MAIDFKVLAKKKGPLPVWAWALISAVLVYMLYRHFQSSGGGSSSQSSGTPSAMDTGTTSQQAPGDLLSSGVGNAANDPTATGAGLEFGDRNIASSVNDFVDQLLAQESSRVAAANDASQGTNLTSAAGDTTQQGADLGLTHISGPWWWDSVNRKLVKIPGSGGSKKGSGKKVVPNTKKAGGKKTKPGKPKTNHATRVVSRGPRNGGFSQVRGKPKLTKNKTIPQRQTPRLTTSELKAINRAHQPAPRPVVKKSTRIHKVIRPPRPSKNRSK
jgi:hypothetical protein